VVDGNRYGQLGFHSDKQKSPWLLIDLGKPSRISRVVVYGREECCFDQSLPLALEVSTDGRRYHRIAKRVDPFSQSEPWVVVPAGEVRLVRLKTLRNSYLVLSEVEVFGRRSE
jgi:hypothetical protein